MEITIPPQLAHLKTDSRGYPIPFFVPVINGVPNFRFADKGRQEASIERHLCHICGKKLLPDYWYFISGPKGYENRVSSDAAMHRVCAEFALQTCPHLFFLKAERKETEGINHTAILPEKPTTLYLIKSNQYKAKFHPELGHKLIHYKAVGFEKYIYVDNKLQKLT